MTPPYTPPAHKLEAFSCPSCGAYANQFWSNVGLAIHNKIDWRTDWQFALCVHCEKPTVWFNASMVYPSGGNAPLPNADLPPDISKDYEEARAILNRSPRGAAALLRLAIQKLCKELGERGDNINTDIAALSRKGLLPSVQQAMDAVRVIGNNAVHPGQIDLQDDIGTASTLFRLVNLITDQLITAPKETAAIYNSLPQATREAIARRDGTLP